MSISLLLLGAFLSATAFWVGLIFPKVVLPFSKNKSRIQVLKIYLPLTSIFLILTALTIPSDELSLDTSTEARQNHESEVSASEETSVAINLKDKIKINDPVLKTNLEEKVFGYGLTGELYGEDLVDLVEFVIPIGSSGPVSDLTGIEYAINLEYLTMPGHEVTDLSKLSSLSKLKDISANNNKISDLSSLAKLKELEALGLARNNLANIDALKNLDLLSHVDLEDNDISDISSLANKKDLAYLLLSKNNISDISPLQNNSALEYLDLRDNNITDISALKNLQNLRIVHLDGNPINDLSPLLELNNLDEVHINVTIVELANPRHIRDLDEKTRVRISPLR